MATKGRKLLFTLSAAAAVVLMLWFFASRGQTEWSFLDRYQPVSAVVRPDFKFPPFEKSTGPWLRFDFSKAKADPAVVWRSLHPTNAYILVVGGTFYSFESDAGGVRRLWVMENTDIGEFHLWTELRQPSLLDRLVRFFKA
ncbi:MAG TPA: hypothetical protein VHE55_08685 [Fimbriimonadaceae bacterium]|nr:hypothetical protein [Fimbriimonadaceae bacterium]